MTDPAPPTTPAVDAVARGTSDALEDLVSWTRRAVAPHGMSRSAAATLARTSRSGSAGISALAALEGVSQPAMSQLLARLERDGLVVRTARPDDARAVVVTLTPAGERVVAQRRADRTAALAELLARASPADVALVAAALPALHRLTHPTASTGAATAPASSRTPDPSGATTS